MNQLDDVNQSLSPAGLPNAREERVSSTRGGLNRYSPGLFVIGRLVFGSLFIAASADKILHPGAFAQVVYNYQLLPDYAVNLVAILLPWLELILGLLILFGLWLPGALVIANLLLISFSSSLAFNLIRGLDVHCGCFSSSASTPTSVWIYVLRDIAFLGLGGYLFRRVFR
ncbi:MAG: MauE/DoxX family redox-associated membrane protein [Syntrophobacteraceae bacterium]